ncbi:ExbD/TolR family protein [Shewanella algae]|uniref:ExbD/TolR family protein n=1 Tax=Shewanella algae TaxID=38313 RepID=UPI0031F57EE0
MIEIKEEHGLDSGLDLTPLIDIIFIVLVFLLLTANPKLLSLPIEVPDNSSTTLSPQAQTQLTVSVLPQAPFWALNEQKFARFDAFEQALTQALADNPELTLVVAADKEARVQPLMQLLSLLQRLEISQTRVLMEP